MILIRIHVRLIKSEGYHCSPGFFALQATILTFSAATWLLLSSLKLMSLMRNVQTSSQKRYVSK